MSMSENPFTGLVGRLSVEDLRQLLDATLLQLSKATADVRWTRVRALSLMEVLVPEYLVPVDVRWRASAEAIVETVAGVCHVDPKEVLGDGRPDQVVMARHIAMVIHSEVNHCSDVATARAFGRSRDIMRLARRRTQERRETDRRSRPLIDQSRAFFQLPPIES